MLLEDPIFGFVNPLIGSGGIQVEFVNESRRWGIFCQRLVGISDLSRRYGTHGFSCFDRSLPLWLVGIAPHSL